MNSQLKQFAKNDQVDRALEIFKQIEKSGLEVERYSYHALIAACGRVNEFEICDDLIHSMADQGIEPNTRTYNIFLNLSIKSGNVDKVFSFYNKMKESSLLPDSITYDTLIRVSMNTGQYQKAIHYFKDMVSECTPDISLFQFMIQKFALKEDHDKMFLVLDAMKRKKVEPNDTIKAIVSEFSDMFNEN